MYKTESGEMNTYASIKRASHNSWWLNADGKAVGGYTWHYEIVFNNMDIFEPFFSDSAESLEELRELKEEDCPGDDFMRDMLFPEGWIRVGGDDDSISFIGHESLSTFYTAIDTFLSTHKTKEVVVYNETQDNEDVFVGGFYYKDWIDTNGSAKKAIQQGKRIKATIDEWGYYSYFIFSDGKIVNAGAQHAEYIENYPEDFSFIPPEILKKGLEEEESGEMLDFLHPYIIKGGVIFVGIFIDEKGKLVSFDGDKTTPDFYNHIDNFISGGPVQNISNIEINEDKFTYQDWVDNNGSSQKSLQQVKRIEGGQMNTYATLKQAYAITKGQIKERIKTLEEQKKATGILSATKDWIEEEIKFLKEQMKSAPEKIEASMHAIISYNSARDFFMIKEDGDPYEATEEYVRDFLSDHGYSEEEAKSAMEDLLAGDKVTVTASIKRASIVDEIQYLFVDDEIQPEENTLIRQINSMDDLNKDLLSLAVKEGDKPEVVKILHLSNELISSYSNKGHRPDIIKVKSNGDVYIDGDFFKNIDFSKYKEGKITEQDIRQMWKDAENRGEN